MALNPLLEPLTTDQRRLIQTIFEPFDTTGVWPLWQYVDLTMDARHGLDAAAVLESLPVAGSHEPRSRQYGLTWRMDPHMQPGPEHRIGLTVAGLAALGNAEPLLGAVLTTIRYLVEQQRLMVPNPDKLVEATVTSTDLAERLLTASIEGQSAPPVAATMAKLCQVLPHEPPLATAVQPPPWSTSEEWTVRVVAGLRDYRDVASISDYLNQVVDEVAPVGAPPVPPSFGALDVPYAIGYLDAVWKNRSGCQLFVNVDTASVARLTLACADQEDFNSLMSALSDVLGQVVVPGQSRPPQKAALERVGEFLASSLEPEASARVEGAIQTLINLRRVRAATQHADARHKAVVAFKAIGLAFPPPSWPQAWAHVAGQAKGALDMIREEVHAGLSVEGQGPSVSDPAPGS